MSGGSYGYFYIKKPSDGFLERYADMTEDCERLGKTESKA